MRIHLYGNWNIILTHSEQIERVKRCALYILGDAYSSVHALNTLECENMNDRRIKLCENFADKSVKTQRYSSLFSVNTAPPHTIKARSEPTKIPNDFDQVMPRTHGSYYTKSPLQDAEQD